MFTPIPADPIATHDAEASRCMAREMTVLSPSGVHIQPAVELSRIARQFQSSIQLVVDGRTYAAHVIIEVLAADLQYGKSLTVVAEGSDAVHALASVERFFGRHVLQAWETRQPSPLQRAA